MCAEYEIHAQDSFIVQPLVSTSRKISIILTEWLRLSLCSKRHRGRRRAIISSILPANVEQTTVSRSWSITYSHHLRIRNFDWFFWSHAPCFPMIFVLPFVVWCNAPKPNIFRPSLSMSNFCAHRNSADCKENRKYFVSFSSLVLLVSLNLYRRCYRIRSCCR